MTTNSSHPGGLAVLFASASLARVLGLFMREPQRAFYQRELMRLTGTPLRQLQRDLNRLVAAGLVTKTPTGNRAYYRVIDAHPAFDDLRRAFLKTIGLGDALRGAIEPLGNLVTVAFIYGSFAAGDDTVESDVDLFVIGEIGRRAFARALADVSRELGRELNPVIFSPSEFRHRVQSGDHFVTATLAEPRIWIVGDERALAALA